MFHIPLRFINYYFWHSQSEQIIYRWERSEPSCISPYSLHTSSYFLHISLYFPRILSYFSHIITSYLLLIPSYFSHFFFIFSTYSLYLGNMKEYAPLYVDRRIWTNYEHWPWNWEKFRAFQRGGGAQILGYFFISLAYFFIFSTYFFIFSSYFFTSPTYSFIFSTHCGHWPWDLEKSRAFQRGGGGLPILGLRGTPEKRHGTCQTMWYTSILEPVLIFELGIIWERYLTWVHHAL